MNKYFKLLILVVWLVTSTVCFSGSIKLDANHDINPGIDFLENNVNNELTIINDYFNIAVLKNEIINNNEALSNLELAKEIRISVGESIEVVNAMEDEVLLEVLNYTEVQSNINYFKVNEKGDAVQISQSQFDIDVESKLNKQKASTFEYQSPNSTNSINEWHSQDGYLKITSMSARTYGEMPDRDYYILSGVAEWKIIPVTKSNDVLVINSSANIDNYYNFYGSVHYNIDCNGSGGHNVIDNHTEYSYKNDNYNDFIYAYNPSAYGLAIRTTLNGKTCPYLDHNYPGYGSWHETNFNSIIIYGQYKVSIYEQDASCQVAYSHRTFGLDPISPSITIKGVSFAINLPSTKIDYFADAFTIYYSPGHNHIYRYERYSPTQHKSICIDCGHYSFENHNWVHQQGGFVYCKSCNYISDVTINSGIFRLH